MPRAYYNEFDPYAAQWLRNLVAAGHIAPGDVDERSIEDVKPGDVTGYTQCHFFAGIGVWSYALRRAGWSDGRPVWTGSCPCQPFSQAGQGNGFADERHLWPAWFHLISQCQPGVVFGEQVASRDGLAWLDLVLSDLEAAGYARGAVDLCAAGVGAPHIRQRLWIYANPLANADVANVDEWTQAVKQAELIGGGSYVLMANTDDVRLEGFGGGYQPPGWGAGPTGPVNGHWSNADWLFCRDGKWRAVEPSTFPLANGAPSRVGRLRAYGNAIVAQAAEEVIRAYMECRP